MYAVRKPKDGTHKMNKITSQENITIQTIG